MNNNVLSCLLKDSKEVNAVMLVGRLFHARATDTRNDRSPMVLSQVRGTIRRGQEQVTCYCNTVTLVLPLLLQTNKLYIPRRGLYNKKWLISTTNMSTTKTG